MTAGGIRARQVNYPAPGMPRTRDGKPDLSGVRHVQPTPRDETKRIFADNTARIELPGMEIETISKYGIDILPGFKPGEAPVHPEAADNLRQRWPMRFPPELACPPDSRSTAA